MPLTYYLPHPKSPSFRSRASGTQSWRSQQVVEEDPGKETSCWPATGFRSCGEATTVDVRCTQHDEFSWTALISQHTNCGDGRQALRIYEHMRQSGIKPISYTFVVTLKACSSLQDLESAKRIHAHIVETGNELDVHVGTMLVDVYAKCGSLVDAARVFREMPNRNIVSWNAMILGYAQMQEGEKALQLYALMQKQGLVPNNRTFVAALKACCSLAALGKGKNAQGTLVKDWAIKKVRTIHSQALKNGSDLFVDTMLVDVYAKCGSLIDARHVFDMMPCRNVVSWTAMISGYAQMGEGSQALQLFARMQEEGVVPNSQTLVAALKACSSLAESVEGNKADQIHVNTKCLEQVRAIHSKVSVLNVFVGNMLVDVYAKCGSLLEAKYVFDTMPHRNVVSWNTMILGYANSDKGIDALLLYGEMQLNGVLPDERTFVAALKACSTLADEKMQCLEHVRTICLQIGKQGCQSDLFVCNMLVDVFAKCGSLVDARLLFDRMPHRSVVSWNAMILGYAQMGEGEEALVLYRRMQQEGMPPDDRTFVGALKACTCLAALEVGNGVHGRYVKEGSLELLKAIHLDAVKEGSEKSVFVGNLLVDAYAKCGSLVDARHVFETMPYHDVVSWNAMILGYAQMGEGKEALQLYAQMQQEGKEPDERTFVGVLKACSRGSWEDDDTYGRCSREKCLEQVRAIHSDVRKTASDSSLFLGTMLVDLYAQCGSLVDARCVFQNMPVRNVVCWNAMIMGCVQMEEGEEALQLYEKMHQEGGIPDNQTFIGALKACGVVAGLQRGKEIHAEICTRGLESTCLIVSTALIDMYGKCGSMVDAQHVFDKLPSKDIVSWSALIAGYTRHGESEAVFQLFHRMIEEDVQPNGITFQSILTACSHAGLVDRGQQYFKIMSRDYSITPTIEHHTCMVDLLGRAGHVDQAIEMARSMPFQPDGVVWETVLGACLKWNNVQIGRQVFESAVRLEKNDAGPYVLMSNIYAAANMPEGVKGIQAMRRRAGAWKQPGQSWWTDGNGIVHVFLAGDDKHPYSQEIHASLQDIVVKMRREGYVVDSGPVAISHALHERQKLLRWNKDL